MPDIIDPNWSERDDRNAENVPDGWPPGLPAFVELVGRMMMGAIKRFWNKANPVYLTTGTADAYVVTPEANVAFINIFEVIRVRFDRANASTTPTFQWGAASPRTIVKVLGTGIAPLAVGDLVAGKDHSIWYNGTNFVLSNPGTVTAAETSGLLKAANNLSDVLSTTTALSNIGGMAKATYDPQNIAADAFARANQTGTQAISTVLGLQTALDAKFDSGNFGAGINAATAKTSLVDADKFPIADSAASFAFKSVTLANLITSIFTTARKIANGYFLSSFRLWDATDNTKGLGWVLSGITTATTRLITMADRDVNLMNVPTPWVSYTPTFNGIGTAASVKCRSRRAGANLEVEALFTTGTVTATTFDMSLGFNGVNGGVVCDTFWNSNRPVVGVGVLNVAGATSLYVLGLGGSNVINISFASSGRDGLSPVPGTAIGTASVVGLRFSIPIDGWNV